MKRHTNLLEFLKEYTQSRVAVGPTHGGGPTLETPAPAQAQPEYLQYGLKDLIENNNAWLAVLYGLMIALIILLSILLWMKQDNKPFFFAILGGQGTGIIFFINRLGYYYAQKRTSETLLYLYTAATTPAEKEKIVNEIIKFLTGKKK